MVRYDIEWCITLRPRQKNQTLFLFYFFAIVKTAKQFNCDKQIEKAE